MAGFETATCGLPNCGATPFIFIIQDATRSLRIIGKIGRKKKIIIPTIELSILLSNFFSKEYEKRTL